MTFLIESLGQKRIDSKILFRYQVSMNYFSNFKYQLLKYSIKNIEKHSNQS